MAYRLVYSDFWNDPKVMEEMSPEDRYFYLFLLTNPCTTSCGIYLITKKQMAFQLGNSIEEVNSLMDRFENQYKLIAYNGETRELAIKNWGKYNLSRGGKPVVDCLTAELQKVKDKSLIEYIAKGIRNELLRGLYESFYDTLATGTPQDLPLVDNTDTNTSTSTSTYTERETTITTVNSNDELSEENLDVQSLAISIINEFKSLTGYRNFISINVVRIAVAQHGYVNVKRAMTKAVEQGKFSMAYVNGILRTWKKEGYPKEERDDGSCCKIHGGGTSQFKGFKVHQPRELSEQERNQMEEQLL